VTVAAIRVDADREIGFGHLERCIAVARELKEANHEPVFVTCEKSIAIPRLAARGITAVETFVPGTATPDAAEALSSEIDAILRRGPGLVIFDIGSTSHELAAAVKAMGCFVVSFEDLGDGRYLADLVVDANLTESTNPRKMTTTTRYLLGPEYAVISPECLKAKKKRRRFQELRRIIVSCGGSDPAAVTPHVIAALATLDTEIDIEVVLGPGFAHAAALDRAILATPRICSIVESPSDLPDRLRAADIGIISGGVTLYEAAFLGLPSIVIAQNPAQLRNLPPFDSRNAIINLGLAANNPYPNLLSAIRRLADSAIRRSMSEALEKHVDGRGIQRLGTAVREVLGR
jgi:spore coat polysaccharide biosynthesis predicted glycosyltransferase SpsG